jgi:hypothetical protein
MPCLLAVLVVAFPRVAIVLLYLFTNFFSGVFNTILVPILGFLFLPITLITYTYIHNTHMAVQDVTSLVILFIAVILDLGLVGGAARRRS